MRLTQHRRARLAARAMALGLVFAASVSGCDDDDTAEQADVVAEDSVASSATPTETETPAPDASDGASAGTDPAAEEPESSSAPAAPAALPADLPDGFPDIGVPFYTPSTQVAGTGEPGGMYVLEYVTEHELTIVNMFVRDSLAAKGWNNIVRTVEGQMTISKATARGYSLVMAVGPERTDEMKTSIHYTVRPQ